MIQVLLFFSLLLHGVTALWIFTLMKRIDLSTSTEHGGDKLKREIEDLLLAYTEEMKAENKKLLRELDRRENTPKRAQPLSNEEERAPDRKQAGTRIIEEPNKQVPPLDYSPPLPDDEEKPFHYSESETARVLSLAETGHSAEQIAKRLNIGTGEVELLLKFYK